jgi:hypothetical protein
MKRISISARRSVVTDLFIIFTYLCGYIGINGQEFWRVGLVDVDPAADVDPVNIFAV